MDAPSNPKKTGIIVLVVIIAAVGAYLFLTMPDRRTPAQKLGDAIGELPNGPDKAMRQLEDRTPAQKAADAVKDATTPRQ